MLSRGNSGLPLLLRLYKDSNFIMNEMESHLKNTILVRFECYILSCLEIFILAALC